MAVSRHPPRPYLILLLAALSAAVALSLVSVHTRLLNSGLGCESWPECYGHIAPPANADGAALPRGAPKWATAAHRTLASGLGLLIIAISLIALRSGREWTDRRATLLLLATMVGLAVLGRWSSGLTIPGVVMANFAGGLLLAALLWWLYLSATVDRGLAGAPGASTSGWVVAGTALLIVQLALGGMVSAWFAALACGPSPTCGGNWLPALPLPELARPFQPLELDAGGKVVAGPQMAGLHMAHRWAGLALLPLLTWLALIAWKRGLRATAAVVLAAATGVTVMGLAAVALALPNAIVLGHYLLALILLLALLHLLFRISPERSRRAIQ